MKTIGVRSSASRTRRVPLLGGRAFVFNAASPADASPVYDHATLMTAIGYAWQQVYTTDGIRLGTFADIAFMVEELLGPEV